MQTPSNEEVFTAETDSRSIHDYTAVTGSLGVTGIAWSMDLQETARVVVETGSIALVAGSVVVSSVAAARKFIRNRRN